MKDKSKRRGNPWFRLYADMADDPKAQLLSDSLFKTWINLLCLACQFGGVLPSLPDIAFKLRLSEPEAQARLDQLAQLGLIDITPDGQLEPHYWRGRQYVSDNPTPRVQRHRERRKRQRNVSRNDNETPPESDPKSEIRKDSLSGLVLQLRARAMTSGRPPR